MLVNTIPSVVFKGYADWSVEFFDDKFEKTTGYPVMDFNIPEDKWDEIILPEDLERAKEIFKQALKGDKSYMREYRIKTKSGDVLWIRERGQISAMQDGKIDYITGTLPISPNNMRCRPPWRKMQQHNEMILNSWVKVCLSWTRRPRSSLSIRPHLT